MVGPWEVAPPAERVDNEAEQHLSWWQRRGFLAQLRSMPGVAYSWVDEPSGRPHDGQAWVVHGTRGERWEEGLVGRRIAAEDAAHGLAAQSRHKKPSDAMTRVGSLGSWEPYLEGTRSSQSAEE